MHSIVLGKSHQQCVQNDMDNRQIVDKWNGLMGVCLSAITINKCKFTAKGLHKGLCRCFHSLTISIYIYKMLFTLMV